MTPTMRKKALIVLLLTSASLLLFSCQGKGSRSRTPMVHVGTWSGVDSSNMQGVVTFRENGTGTMEFGNQAYAFQYWFDYSKRPVWLDLLYSREGKPFQARLIVRYSDEDHLQWYTFFSEERPEEFPKGDEEGVFKLTRVKPPRGA